MTSAPILVVGAGPTGLVLALSLAQRGVPLRIIDDNAGPGEHSRATVVHSRTLEFYRQFGFADEVVAEGIKSPAIHLRRRDDGKPSREIMRVNFGEVGKGLSSFPYILTYPQDAHERLLVRQLAKRGIAVERSTALADFQQDGDGVNATITRPDGSLETARFSYICGCDGAHSRVRAVTGVGFSGGTYDQPFYVADVRLEGPQNDDLYLNLGNRLLSLMMPVRVSGTERLIGLVPPALAEKKDLSFEDLRSDAEDLIGIRVGVVNWFSRYRVHHRVADHFRVGRAFLLGDAGHLHSPVGGQGMNTGIGDAINLGWKLAAVTAGNADPALLDTYEPERISFARQLVATTDRVFAPMISGGVKGELIRRIVAPLVGWLVTSFDASRRVAFRTVSQIEIHYPDSPLSAGRAGKVRGGDRLPWVEYDTTDNYAPLASADWQIHVYGQASPELNAAAARLGLPVHTLPWGDAPRRAGLLEGSVYLIRPDGYVGYVGPGSDAQGLERYVAAWQSQSQRPSGV